MRKLLLVPAISAVALAAAVPAAHSARSVKVGDNFFVRPSGVPTVDVAKGETVKWVWSGKNPHQVKVASGPVKFGSSTQTSGSFKKRLSRKGTYTIVCTVHGAGDQSMKLVVK